jgi:hypothetical protein
MSACTIMPPNITPTLANEIGDSHAEVVALLRGRTDVTQAAR